MTQCWDHLRSLSTTDATKWVTDTVLRVARDLYPIDHSSSSQITHPWLNDRAVALVDAKRVAQGTPLERETTLACSAGLAAEYHDYIVRTAQKMRELKPSSKLWWKKAKEVMKHEAQVSSIPALKTNDGVWVLNAQGKANLFADTFAGKCKLPQPRLNVYTECHQCPEIQGSFVFPSEKQCRDAPREPQ